MVRLTSPGSLESPELQHTEETGFAHWIVTVYNNETNTYEEVITVLMLATGCNYDEAYMEAWEIDHLGKSVVHWADEEECTAVASVVRRIGIRVEVTEE